MGFFGVDKAVDLYHFTFSILLDEASLGIQEDSDLGGIVTL
jgi:hypothetical protein